MSATAGPNVEISSVASYERKELRILGGGLNLLPAGDKVPPGDYLIAQNWRPDQAGKLVSRYGYPLKFAWRGTGSAHSAAIHGGVLGDYYIGTDAGELWVLIANVPTKIASGLSGNRLGMVPMLGSMWIVDQKAQGSHQAGQASLQQIGITKPAAACTAAAGTADATGPNGTYYFYVTFVHDSSGTSDLEVESNPSPVSASQALTNQDVILSAIPTSGDSRVNRRNLYATGGTLGGAYLIGTIADNTTTIATFNATDNAANPGSALLPAWNDSTAVNNGVSMPTTNDSPPAAAGLGGPYFNRLVAWRSVGRVNRFWWTDAGLPQYWPGSADTSATGNWADVGADGEGILWCTFHPNCMIIYKERSIWRLSGPPDATAGVLELLIDGVGLVNPWAVTQAGQIDYFVAPIGLYICTLDGVLDITGPLRPIFTLNQTNTGSLSPPGAIMPGTDWYSNPANSYSVALGYGMGKLYLSYSERASVGASYVLMVFHEQDKRWVYHRNLIGTGHDSFTSPSAVAVRGFIFDGVEMVGLTGPIPAGYNLDDYRQNYNTDYGNVPYECVMQSRYEDGGAPDRDKQWLDLTVDHQIGLGITAEVYVDFNLAGTPTKVGTIIGTGARVQSTFAVNTLARTCSVIVHCESAPATLYDVFLYYYVEARLSMEVSTLPMPIGGANLTQAKELMLDIDGSQGDVAVNIWGNMPLNPIQKQTALTASAPLGRSTLRIPFTQGTPAPPNGGFLESFIWKVDMAAKTGPFRLYAARMLMRPIGTFIAADEASGGFVWDSQELSFDSGITHIPRGYAISLAALPIKRAREIRLCFDSYGASVTVKLLSDLPGNAQAVRFTASVQSTGGRRYVSIPLPAGTNAPIEGRMFRLQLSSNGKFVIYEAAIEILAVGVYIEDYEASGGALYDSRELDFGTPAIKEARELELDIETTGAVGMQLLSDISATVTGTANTTGRQKVMIPLTVNADASQFIEGRLLRMILSGNSAFRLYGAKLKVRAFGEYLLAAETAGGALWDSTELDLGTQTVKQIREIEVEIWAYSSVTVKVYTDLPGNQMAVRATSVIAATGGRTKVQIPLPQGQVPDNYLYGRLVRVTVSSAGSFKMFGARIHARPVGVYVESYEAAGGAVWDSTPSDLGSPDAKTWDQVRFELDTDGAAQVAFYTDLPGEAFTLKLTAPLTNGATGRHWATVPLPAATEGRSCRMVVSSAAGFRIYRAQVRAFKLGRYLAAPGPAGNDAFNTLEFDFTSERLKAYKRVEIDARADAPLPISIQTEQSGRMAEVFSGTLATPGGRTPVVFNIPPGIRGRLLRVSLAGVAQARVYGIRVWARPLNEQSAWAWEEYPLEKSDVLPAWADLPVPETPPAFAWADLPVAPTPPEWSWVPFPVTPTEPQWFWAKVLSVDETPEKWEWVDLDFQVNS